MADWDVIERKPITGGAAPPGEAWSVRSTTKPSEGPPAETSPLSVLWENLKGYGAESLAALGEGARRLPGEALEFGRDIGESLLPGRGGAEAGGRMLGKVGDIATFLSGGGVGHSAPKEQVRMPASPGTPQQTLQDFQRLQMTPSAPAISQGRITPPALTRSAGRALPFSPVERGLQRNIEVEAPRAAEGIAAQQAAAGAPVSAEGAGNIAQNALNRFATDRTQAATDYNEFDRLMHGAPPVQMSRTLTLLNNLRGRFPNAPELGGLFTNSKFSTMRSALEPRVEVTPAETSGILDASGRPIVTRPEMRTQRGGELSMPEIKELRSQVGYLIENPQFGPENIPKAQLRSLYGTLTQDLQTAARARGPAAMKALVRATTNYGMRQRVMERLEPLIKPDAPEAAFSRINNAAQSTGSADAQLLKTAKDIMRPDEWNDIGSAMIRRLGFPRGVEKADTLGPDFALSAYDRNWRKMSPRAKEMFFGDDTPGSVRNGLETLARVARNKALTTQRGRSAVSGGVTGGAMVAVEEALRHVMGMTGGAAAVAGGLAGTYGLSKLMMSPRFAQWLYQLPRMTIGGPESEGTQSAQTALRAAMAAAADDRRREAERADLRGQAYRANRRGDLSEVERLGNQRRSLAPPIAGF